MAGIGANMTPMAWMKPAGARFAALLGMGMAVGMSARCSCEPEAGPVDAGQIGEGPPIEEPDAGDPYERDAGPVVCEEDGQEDNDVRDSASVLSSGVATAGRFCGEDDDWYAINVAAGCNVLAELAFEPSDGDLDMLLFNPGGQLVASASGLEDAEALNVQAGEPGLYAVRLRGGSRDDIAYTVTMTASCPQDLECPADDAHEDNDSADQPAPLLDGVSVDGILCGTDADFYSVPVAQGCIADARLSFSDVDGDIDIELRRADGTTVQGSSRGVADSERVTKVVVEGGMSYRVYFGVADPANLYRFEVDEVCAVACPTDDPFEPNNERASSAPDLQARLDEVVGAVCANDDFFDLSPIANCPMRVTLQFDDAHGDLDLQLLDGSNAVLASSSGTGNTEQIDHTATSAARVWLRVFGFNDATATYRMHVETTCP
jgi:hypothetical protein